MNKPIDLPGREDIQKWVSKAPYNPNTVILRKKDKTPSKCPKCASDNTAGLEKCEWCGYALTGKKVCNSCAGDNDYEASKCEWCGNPMEVIEEITLEPMSFNFLRNLYRCRLPELYSAPRMPIYRNICDVERNIPPPPEDDDSWSEEYSAWPGVIIFLIIGIIGTVFFILKNKLFG